MIRRHLSLAVSIVALACAPRVMVRPGERGEPTIFRVRIRARAVTLSGTMTGWRGQPLARRGDSFELRAVLPPGRYEYRLEALDETGMHPVFPEGMERTSDGFGGENAVLRIRGNER